MAKVIDGKALAAEIKLDLAEKILELESRPALAVVLVGDNPASSIYVNNKKKLAQEIGMECEVHHLSASSSEEEVISLVEKLDVNKDINGIIVQLPLPEHMDSLKIISLISQEKDVDGLGPYNAGLLQMMDEKAVIAATPKGIMYMIDSLGLNLRGKNAVVIGRSNIVGRPISNLLTNTDMTVTVAHSYTLNLPEICKNADILVVACGCPKLVKKDWVKDGAVIIDVGITRLENGKLSGDVDYDEVFDVAGYITPVPGGVGPMTVAMLMKNTYEAYVKQRNL